jgi:hypothetical protein
VRERVDPYKALALLCACREVLTSATKVTVSPLCLNRIYHEFLKGAQKHRTELLAIAEIFVGAFDTPRCLLSRCTDQGKNLVHKL